MVGAELTFTFAAAATGEPDLDDGARYQERLADCRLGQILGYDAAWFLEHHFTNYFPTPSPMLFMAHVAARCPGLSLGTAVLVTPWYQPIRLAEEIAMLSQLCQGELHLGVGRGTAKLEYDAYGVDIEEARERYREGMAIITRALAGETFRHDGGHYRIGREVCIRPRPKAERIHFYGAIGSPGSAEIVADMGMPPLCVTQFPPSLLERIMTNWQARAREIGLETTPVRPIMSHAFLAESDDQARALAREYLVRHFTLQVEHYEAEADHWAGIKGYEQFSRMFGNLKQLADPANLDGFMDFNLNGSADTVAERIEMFAGLGFNHIILQCATDGIPRAVRHDTLERFATAVAPRFSSAFGRADAAAE